MVGSVECSGMMFWGHPLRDFLPAVLPDVVIVQLKLVMDSLVKGQFRLTRGKPFSSILVREDERTLSSGRASCVELWEGKLSEFNEEMLLTLLWERPVMRDKELPDYIKVNEYASLAVFAVSQQLEVFEQLPKELQTHDMMMSLRRALSRTSARQILPPCICDPTCQCEGHADEI